MDKAVPRGKLPQIHVVPACDSPQGISVVYAVNRLGRALRRRAIRLCLYRIAGS